MALSGDNFMFGSGGGGSASQCRTKMHYENPFTMENKSKREKRQRYSCKASKGFGRIYFYYLCIILYRHMYESVAEHRALL